MTSLAHTIVIATYERPEEMALALESIAISTRQPESVLIVDSSQSEEVRIVTEQFKDRLPIRWIAADVASAAEQRNQGARLVTTPLIVFMDDDAILRPDTLALLLMPFDTDTEKKIGGIGGRIEDMAHKHPTGLIRLYYRIQAGFAHRDYGGKLFGPGINCVPAYTEDDPELIPSDWIHSTLVAYRTEVFMAELFPSFQGYSSMEDVHVSARIGRHHALYFHKNAFFAHHSASSSFKRDYFRIARTRIRNQYQFAKTVLHRRGLIFECKFALHRAFVSANLLRYRNRGWIKEILGTWF